MSIELIIITRFVQNVSRDPFLAVREVSLVVDEDRVIFGRIEHVFVAVIGGDSVHVLSVLCSLQMSPILVLIPLRPRNKNN